MWSWYTDRWWVGCFGTANMGLGGVDRSRPRPLLAVPNVTAHPSTAGVPITVVLLYSVPIEGLSLTYW